MSAKPSPSTPARLTATATSKLPRAFLFAVGVVYILAGLFFRDPWKTDDVVGLATMLTALNDGGVHTWWLPHVGELAQAQGGPLTVWAGGFSIAVFSPLLQNFVSPLDAAIIASRLPNLLWFALLCWSVWYGSYLLGRRPEPQPLALPFGGEPAVRDYGRMIADAALLLIVATVGIVWRMHETSGVPALIAFQSLSFYAVARMIDRPASGALTLGFALAAVLLTAGGTGALPVMLAAILSFRPGTVLWRQKKWLVLALGIAACAMLLWWLVLAQAGSVRAADWRQWHFHAFTGLNAASLFSLLRDLPWFLWPTWPFALLALWQWRQWSHAPHIWVPLAFAVTPLILMLFQDNVFEPEYSLLAVPCAVLASFALPTLRRGVVNSLDWFAVMCFSLTSATVWLGWIALHTGWPSKIAHNIARQTKGYEAQWHWPALLVAILGTLSWLALVRWRLYSRPLALWRGTVLSAGGLIVTWLLLVSLWMPVLDYVRSYRDVSAELSSVLARHQEPGDCLRALDVGIGQQASFLVFNGIRFSHTPGCTLVLQQTSPGAVNAGLAFEPSHSRILWEGKRRPDRHEMFRLFRRTQ